tara:strand:+ start:215 stop:448 length:234 start_codon:yes stop_codon:yes gene_type:complete
MVELVILGLIMMHRMVDLEDQVVELLNLMEQQDQVHLVKVVMVEQDQELLVLLRTLVVEAVVPVVTVVTHQEMLLEE